MHTQTQPFKHTHIRRCTHTCKYRQREGEKDGGCLLTHPQQAQLGPMHLPGWCRALGELELPCVQCSACTNACPAILSFSAHGSEGEVTHPRRDETRGADRRTDHVQWAGEQVTWGCSSHYCFDWCVPLIFPQFLSGLAAPAPVWVMEHDCLILLPSDSPTLRNPS